MIVTFRCPQELIELVTEQKKELRISRSMFIRRALELAITLLKAMSQQQPPSPEIVEVINTYFQLGQAEPATPDEDDSATPPPDMKNERNIKQLNREEHTFCGYRIAITRRKEPFRRYFSITEYGGWLPAQEAAIAVRDYIVKQFELHPDNITDIYAQAHAMLPPPYPHKRRRIRRPRIGGHTEE